jgi:hypothetical protein
MNLMNLMRRVMMRRDTKENPVEPRPIGDWRELDDGFSEWADMLVWAVTAIAAVGLVAFVMGVASAIFKL